MSHKTAELPKITELASILERVKGEIADDYRAFEDDDEPGIQVTVGWDRDNGEWAVQTGDNSFSGAAYFYPIWAVQGLYAWSDCADTAKDLIDELAEQSAQWPIASG